MMQGELVVDFCSQVASAFRFIIIILNSKLKRILLHSAQFEFAVYQGEDPTSIKSITSSSGGLFVNEVLGCGLFQGRWLI